VTRTIKVVLEIEAENVNIWNNAIFAAVGQAGRSINGNVAIRGSVHLLGDGEAFTDLDGDQRWDDNEPYTDSNHNNQYDLGEPFTDVDSDGHRDAREPFADVNGNGTRDPALTVTDLASELSGTAEIGNNYDGMPVDLRLRVPALPTVLHGGELVESLNAKLRAKHGRVALSGTATVGHPDQPGNSVKETVTGTYVNDGFGGNQGNRQRLLRQRVRQRLRPRRRRRDFPWDRFRRIYGPWRHDLRQLPGLPTGERHGICG